VEAEVWIGTLPPVFIMNQEGAMVSGGMVKQDKSVTEAGIEVF
jgi:hypothetical protein